MNKDLINLQRGNKATCGGIKDSEKIKLSNAVIMHAKIDDTWLFAADFGNPIFKEDIETISKKCEVGYFVITNFDEISNDDQNRYIPLIKDREFLGYQLPDNMIIILTIKDKEALKNLSPEIYHFCVVCLED